MALISLDVADDDSAPLAGGANGISQAPCIYLTAAQVKALGITEPPRAGARMSLRGEVCVESSTESKDGDMDDPDIRLTLCLEYAELGAKSAEGERDPSATLYG